MGSSPATSNKSSSGSWYRPLPEVGSVSVETFSAAATAADGSLAPISASVSTVSFSFDTRLAAGWFHDRASGFQVNADGCQVDESGTQDPPSCMASVSPTTAAGGGPATTGTGSSPWASDRSFNTWTLIAGAAESSVGAPVGSVAA